MAITKPIQYRWSDDKNQWLKQTRGFGFEDIVLALEEHGALDDVAHPNPDYAHQRILFVPLQNYVITVPYVNDRDVKFLKTAYASRRARKHYLGPKS